MLLIILHLISNVLGVERPLSGEICLVSSCVPLSIAFTQRRTMDLDSTG
jgi:hypothetical protein